MHGPPLLIKLDYLPKWVHYVMRNMPTGKYQLVHGFQVPGPDPLKTFGPCGANPCAYFEVYDMDGNKVNLIFNSDLEEHVDYCYERYASSHGFDGKEFSNEHIKGVVQVIEHVKPSPIEHAAIKKDYLENKATYLGEKYTCRSYK